MKFTIIGAGMAGLLAAALLRDEAARIVEKQEALPNNHKALLRFRSSIVGDAVGISFKKVQVIKEVEPAVTAIAANLQYGRKVTGALSHRSVLRTSGHEIVERYIAPEDFVERLAKKVMCPIKYNTLAWPLAFSGTAPIISTMPMPALMDQLDYKGERPEFKSVPGVTITARLPGCVGYVTRYATDEDWPFYRVSITGDQLIIEYACPGDDEVVDDLWQEKTTLDHAVGTALRFLGLGEERFTDAAGKVSRYQKIAEADEGLRKRFMIWATDVHNVYSLGRFATWRPGLMLDDLVNDVQQIRKMAATSTFEARKK